MFYSLSRATRLFSSPSGETLSIEAWRRLVEDGDLPPTTKTRAGQGWNSSEIGLVGEKVGFLKPPRQPMVFAIFVTKGGSLKTTLTMNFARLLALHRIKTLVIGLDLQGDMTSAMGYQPVSEEGTLANALKELDATRGLYDNFKGEAGLTDLILPTDLPDLDFIPETPELIALDQELLLKPRREYWLSERVTRPLSQKYEVILIDTSPNWNQLTTNALVACNVLVSPVECRINNFRNLRLYRALLAQCRGDLHLNFEHLFVPTRLAPQRTLSRQIHRWYQDHLPNCLPPVRESVHGEEAMALHISLPEHAPDSTAGREMKSLLYQIWILALSRRQEFKFSVPEVQPWPSA